MPPSPARVAAFDILLRIERESSFAAELLHSSSYARLSWSDHALTTELVMGVLRWRSLLDGQISAVSSQALAKLDLEVLTSLRLGLYQLRWLDRIPKRAALHESVELVKRARKSSAAGFVNAVLRKLSAARPSQKGDLPDSVETLAGEFAHPAWIVARWSNQYGMAAARRICEHNQSVPDTVIRIRNDRADPELKLEGIAAVPGDLLSCARRVTAGNLISTTAFRTGRVVIQDEGSQLIAALVASGLAAGSAVLDCCAAPGGKTLMIADRNPDALITAVELHPHRARLMQNLLQLTRPRATIEVIVGDMRALPGASTFNRVLADVPCTGTGTLARNPEIKWRLHPDDLSDLQARQVAILRSAMSRLRAGGRLIYSTCSLEREENEDVVEQGLAGQDSVRVVDCRGELDQLRHRGELLWPNSATLTQGPYLRTIPGLHPCDGFFAAILERT